MMDLPEIVKLGAKKYFEDQGQYFNPYPHGSAEFNEFERGWMQSLKKDEGRLASKHPIKSSGYALGFPKKERDLPSAVDVYAERYRSLKG